MWWSVFFHNQTWDYTSNACQNSSISLKKNKHGELENCSRIHMCVKLSFPYCFYAFFTSFVFLFQHRRLCWQHQQNWPIRFQENKSRDPAHRKFNGALPYPLNCRCCDLFSFEVMHPPQTTHFALLHYLLTQVSKFCSKTWHEWPEWRLLAFFPYFWLFFTPIGD